MPAYTQGVMDLGATICTRTDPRCADCPVRADCVARRTGRVNELPARRTRRPVPQKTAQMLVLLHGSRALLARRPAEGIWGGLLAPPQFASVAALQREVDALAPGAKVQRLPMRRHAFTHFTLRFTPYVVRVERPSPAARRAGGQWVSRGRIGSAALPAPVRVLLEQLLPEG